MKDKNSKVGYCEWCAKNTKMGLTEQPNTPILEDIEDRINHIGRDKVWGKNADWSILDLDSDFEAELLVYDELLNTMSKRRVCRQCMLEDDMLWERFYGNDEDEDEDDIDFWDDVDFDK
jgi:hypothetical protein